VTRSRRLFLLGYLHRHPTAGAVQVASLSCDFQGHRRGLDSGERHRRKQKLAVMPCWCCESIESLGRAIPFPRKPPSLPPDDGQKGPEGEPRSNLVRSGLIASAPCHGESQASQVTSPASQIKARQWLSHRCSLYPSFHIFLERATLLEGWV